MTGSLRLAALVASFVVAPSIAFAEIDNEHLYGFTEGTDIGEWGDREIEAGTHAAFGKRTGRYRAVQTGIEGKFTVTDDLRISPGLDFAWHDMAGQQAPGGSGFPDHHHAGFSGAHVEMKYRVLDRHVMPFGLTLGATPHWSRRDDASGARADAWGVDLLLSLDKELVPDQWFGAVNLRYGAGTSRLNGAPRREQDSGLVASAGVSTRVGEHTFIGGEIRYGRTHNGLWLGETAGQALFIGPSLYTHLTERLWLSFGWNIQVAGRSDADSRARDLNNFERHQMTLKLGHAF